MVKIWELDFTTFSGASNQYPLDNVGDQNISQVVGTPLKVTPVGGLTNRPGVRFQANNSDQRYELSTGFPSLDVTNGFFKNSYSPTSKRSFAMWCYLFTASRDGDRAMIWGDDNSNTYDSGFVINTSNQFEFYVAGTARYTTSTVSAGSWYHLAMTIDRVAPQTVIYFNGQPVASGTYVPSTSPGFGYRSSIGDTFQTREPNLDLGLVQTYDNILSPSSVEGLYESFIIDSAGGEDPIYTLSGTVYDNTNATVSGAPVALYSPDDNEVYERVDTDGSGEYELQVPFAGDFILFTASTPPGTGARAVSLTASGVAGSGTITFYD